MSPEMSPENFVCCVQHKIHLKSIPSLRLLCEI